LNFLGRVWKYNYEVISNFMKIPPVGAELFHADGWTVRHDETGNAVNAPKRNEFPNMSLTYVDRKLTPGEATLSVVCNYRKAINGRWCA